MEESGTETHPVASMARTSSGRTAPALSTGQREAGCIKPPGTAIRTGGLSGADGFARDGGYNIETFDPIVQRNRDIPGDVFPLPAASCAPSGPSPDSRRLLRLSDQCVQATEPKQSSDVFD